MKTKLIISSICLILLLCGIIFPIASVESNDVRVIVSKPWVIASIVTNPPIIDVDGDGNRDPELVKTLQAGDRYVQFNKDGSVLENAISTGNSQLVQLSGNWKYDNDDNTIVWSYQYGLDLKGTMIGDYLVLTYHDELLEINYTLTLKEKN